MTVKQALKQLDPANDEHWTTDGLPRVDVVSAICNAQLTRAEITEAFPSFTRASAFPPIGTPEHEKQSEPAPDKQDTPDPDAPEEQDAPMDPAEDEVPVDTPETPVEPEEPAEVEDPQTYAYVKPHDNVVTMAVAPVVRDLKLLDRAITEFGRQAAILTARREAVLQKLKDVGRRSALLSTARDKMSRGKNSADDKSAINRYLRTQKELREQRAIKAKKFIEAGTTPKDVLDQLAGPSKVDAALAQGKPGRGSRRPVYPVKTGAGG